MLAILCIYLVLFSLVERRIEPLEASEKPDIHCGQGDYDRQKENDGIVEAK